MVKVVGHPGVAITRRNKPPLTADLSMFVFAHASYFLLSVCVDKGNDCTGL